MSARLVFLGSFYFSNTLSNNTIQTASNTTKYIHLFHNHCIQFLLYIPILMQAKIIKSTIYCTTYSFLPFSLIFNQCFSLQQTLMTYFLSGFLLLIYYLSIFTLLHFYSFLSLILPLFFTPVLYQQSCLLILKFVTSFLTFFSHFVLD